MPIQNIPNNGIENAVGNNIYKDLILTRYPEYFDERSGSKNNPNLQRWKNLTDYNMAEHINTLQDTVMAIERVLGELPNIPTEPIDIEGNPIPPETIELLKRTQTVKARIDILEKRNFDKRYGGPNWKPNTKTTLEEHTHTGGVGKPSKIDLTKEVQNKLPKQNVDLTQTDTGITGSDIFINKTTNITIDNSMGDKLSKSEGGIVKKDLGVEGRFSSRWHRDYDFNDFSGTKVGDNATLLNFAVESHDTNATQFIKNKFSGLYYGRYVLCVRAKTNNRVSGDLLELSTTAQNGDVGEKILIKGTDFKAVNKYQNFYLVFTHEPNTTGGVGEFLVRKLASTSAAKVTLDYALITPTHPAIFDR